MKTNLVLKYVVILLLLIYGIKINAVIPVTIVVVFAMLKILHTIAVTITVIIITVFLLQCSEKVSQKRSL